MFIRGDVTGSIDDFHVAKSVIHPFSRNKGYRNKKREMKNILFFAE